MAGWPGARPTARPTPSTEHRAPSTEHRAPSTEHVARRRSRARADSRSLSRKRVSERATESPSICELSKAARTLCAAHQVEEEVAWAASTRRRTPRVAPPQVLALDQVCIVLPLPRRHGSKPCSKSGRVTEQRQPA